MAYVGIRITSNAWNTKGNYGTRRIDLYNESNVLFWQMAGGDNHVCPTVGTREYSINPTNGVTKIYVERYIDTSSSGNASIKIELKKDNGEYTTAYEISTGYRTSSSWSGATYYPYLIDGSTITATVFNQKIRDVINTKTNSVGLGTSGVVATQGNPITRSDIQHYIDRLNAVYGRYNSCNYVYNGISSETIRMHDLNNLHLKATHTNTCSYSECSSNECSNNECSSGECSSGECSGGECSGGEG